jgi:outer membrane protein assembly factor BamB
MSAIEFLDLLAKNRLVDDKVVAKLRRKVQQSSKRVSARSVAQFLVKQGHLTAEQAKRLTRVPPSPAPAKADDELGLAPDEPLGLKPDEDDLVDIEDDIVEAVEVIPALPDDIPPAGHTADTQDATWGHELSSDLQQQHEEDTGGLLDDVTTSADSSRSLETGRRWFSAMSRKKSSRRASADRWDSPLMLVGGGALLLLIAVGLALYFFLARGTGDDVYNAANESYRQQAYGQAVSLFQRFVANYPDHPKASAAKVRIGTAQIWSQVERQDWQAALDTVQNELPKIVGEEAFGDARPELASLLPEIMEGFADQALGAEDIPTSEQYLARANAAFEEVNNSAYLPTSVRRGQQPRIEQIQAKLDSVTRRISRDRELEQTVAKIRAALADGQIAQAYALRKSLLQSYPSLETDARMASIVLEVAAAECAAVRALTDAPQAVTDDRPAPSQFRVALANRRGARAADLANQILFVAAQGAVYGLKADDGSVLWRHYLGFAAHEPPLELSLAGANDVLIVDQKNQELLRLTGQTGKTVWRLTCPGRPTRPTLDAGRLWLACSQDDHGYVMAVDPATGNVTGGVKLPVPVSVSPTFYPDQNRVIQPAAHSSIYVLDAQDWRCLGVTYLGHASNTIAVSPVMVGQAVLIAENPGVDFGLLHVLSFDADKPGMLRPVGEALRLDGQVIVPPQVFGRRLLLATDRGKLQAFELDLAHAQAPLRLAAETVATVPAGSSSYFLLNEGQLWVADLQLTRYEWQTSRGQLVQKRLSDKGDLFAAPLQLRGSTLFHVRQRRGKLGSTVAAIHVGPDQPGLQEGAAIWEVELGVPPAGEPFVNRAAQQIHVVTGNGALYDIGRDAIRAGLVQNVRQELVDPQLSVLNDEIVLNERLRAFFCSGAAQPYIVSFDTASRDAALRLVALDLAGQRPAATPVAFQQQVLVPTASGAIHLLDPLSGRSAVAPFQSAMVSGTEVVWQRPTVIDPGEQVLLADARGSLLVLKIESDPQPHLAAVKQSQTDRPFVAPAVVLDSVVLGVVRGNGHDELRRFNRDDLQLQDQSDLPGRIIWGPHVVGSLALLMTDKLNLVAVNGTGQVFDIDALQAPAIGLPASNQEGIVLATVDGVLWHIQPTSGDVVGRVEVGETLGTGPVLFSGNRFIVCSGDGTLHIVALSAE